jgi:hypothetical protein
MKRNTIFAIGLILIGAAIVLVAVMMLAPSTMNPADTTANELEQSPAGESVSVVGQVTEINSNVLTVEILEGNGKDVFDKRTGQFLKVEWSPQTEMVMGTADDVIVGALAQFNGTKLEDGTITVQQIVILTGFVQGPP